MREHSIYYSSHRTGLPEVDEQHQQVEQVLIRLHRLLHKPKQCETLLVELENLLADHYKYEEKLMVKCKYSDYEKHQEAHSNILTNIHLLAHEISETNLEKIGEILSHHATSFDKDMGVYLHNF